MSEVYASNEVTAELLDPVTGSVISAVSIPFRRDLTISERPVYAQRGYHRSNTLSAAHLRSLGSVSIRKDAESMALAEEIKRWQKGVVFYALSSDLKGRRYRHPHLRVTFTNADGSTDVVTAYGVKLSDRSLSVPGGGVVGDAISLDVLGGFSPSDSHEPVRALDFHRTGSKTYIGTDGTLKTAGDGEAAFGVPWVVRRNGLKNSENLLGTGWTQNGVSAASAGYKHKDSDVYTITQTSSANYHYLLQTITNYSFFPVSGSTYVYTFLAKASTGSAVRFVQDNSGNGIFINVSFNLSTLTASVINQTGAAVTASMSDDGDGWRSCKVTITYSITPQTSSGMGLSASNSGSSNAIFVCKPQFEPGSTATPYQPTNSTGVDLTHPLNGAGLVLEGASTNLLTANQSSIETDLTGFSSVGTGLINGGSTLTRDASVSCHGSASLKVTTSGSSIAEGVELTAANISNTAPHTVQFMVKGTAGVTLRLIAIDQVAFTLIDHSFKLTGGWDFVSASVGASAGSGQMKIAIRYDTVATTTFWLDTLMLSPMPFPTSWVLGGTTRQPDLCGIVPPHNLVKHSQDFAQSVWVQNVAGSLTSTTATAPDGSATAGTINMAAGAGAGINQTIPGVIFDGKARTFPIWLKGAAGGEQMVIGLARSDTGVMVSQTAITLTNAWQRYYITTTSAAGQGLQLRLARSSTSGSFHFWGAQLVEGSHPGIYVKTTDTAIPAPVSPALDPAWQQNGRITGSFVLPSGANTAAGTLILGGGGLTITQKASTIELSRTTAAGTRTLSITKFAADGTPKAFDASWSHYTDSNGVRKMILTLTVDGTTGTADVAALYGDTAFADLDASRLVSAGSVFATWRDLVTTWPTLPAGSIPAV